MEAVAIAALTNQLGMKSAIINVVVNDLSHPFEVSDCIPIYIPTYNYRHYTDAHFILLPPNEEVQSFSQNLIFTFGYP